MNRPVFETFNQEWAGKIIGRVSRSGIDGYLGIKAVEFEAGRLVCEMPITDELITTMGTMHGGCLSAMCDHVLGVVMYPVMPPGYWAATTEFKINLLAPVTDGTCVATAEIISMSKRLAVVRVEITNGERMVAVAQGTTTIVAPKTSG
ncbi:PaaI family thioesterase [Candidatus Poriferisodalis sp.]|uniref:PaaI family thioesterase n=1 Tax=Candidatus Poriferisodalis sp. TaxID=3101277 RepID=UPI003B51C3BA